MTASWRDFVRARQHAATRAGADDPEAFDRAEPPVDGEELVDAEAHNARVV